MKSFLPAPVFAVALQCVVLIFSACSLASAIDQRIDAFEGINITQPAQCVGWADQYALAKYNCHIPPLGADGGARLIYEDAADHPSNCTQVADTAGALPAVDDIIVFNASVSSSGYGHVGIVAKVNSRTDIEIVDTNWHLDGKGYIHTISLNWSSVDGWFHENNNPNKPGGGVLDPANIYVSLSGSDTSSGSAGAPFRTIRHAIDEASAAQATIYIAPGSYGEKIGTSKHIHFVVNGSGSVQTGG